MNAEKRRSLRAAFILDETRLRELDDILVQTGQPRTYETLEPNGTTLQATDLQSFIKMIASQSAPLPWLEVSTSLAERPHVQLMLGKARTEPDNLYYFIQGSETEVPYLASRLDEWLTNATPWYAWLLRLDPIYAVSGAVISLALTFLVLFGCFSLALLSRGINVPLATTRPVSADTALIVAAVAIGLILVAAGGLVLLRRALFPAVTFAFNAALTRHRLRILIRNAVSTALLIGFTLLCGLVVSFLTGTWS